MIIESRISLVLKWKTYLELFKKHPVVSSLSEYDQFASDEMEWFWLNSRNIQESSVTGCEPFPGEMLKPNSENILLSDSMLNLIVKYYTFTHERYNFCKPADEIDQDAITIYVKINKFKRCQIGSKMFGSAMSIKVCIS